MKYLIFLFGLFSFIYTENIVRNVNTEGQNRTTKDGKIPVLNLGTFHMSFTPDAHKTAFDEHDADNQKEIHALAKQLAKFKPTAIVVELPPKYNKRLAAEYMLYLDQPSMFFEHPSEIELLAYEVGRLSGAKKIYGIDHKMNYNYNIGNELENTIDAKVHDDFLKYPEQTFPEVAVFDSLPTLSEKLKCMNSERYLDFLITINSDILTHAGTADHFEGADEAAKYYQRNLRMYTNLNRLDLNKNDRVFILMGASHTAFFRDFISRSPKYKMVNTQSFLTAS